MARFACVRSTAWRVSDQMSRSSETSLENHRREQQCIHVFSHPVLTAACGLISLVVAVGAVAAGEGDQLSTLARQAAAHLDADQKPGGYWLTTFTASTKFEDPHFEMNVFVTSMIVDLLEPVEAKAGLAEASLERALISALKSKRTAWFVTMAAETRPPFPPSVVSSPRILTTPRWSGGSRRAQIAALARRAEILRSYRTSAGLYRTWLAPRTQYLGIDPGSDPNPADVGIQMHVLMFLAKFDPAGAPALYAALQGAIGDEQNWVYYRLAPLLPLLREADLRRLGYPLRLPPSLSRSPVSGQSDWGMDAGCLLAPYLAAEKVSAMSPKKPRDFSGGSPRMISRPFAANRRCFTTTTSRRRSAGFIGRRILGYALWLRLYLETMALEPAPAERTP